MMYCMDEFRHEAAHGSSPVGSVPGGIRCPSDATCSTRDGSSAQEWQSIGACLFFNGSWHLEKWSPKFRGFEGEDEKRWDWCSFYGCWQAKEWDVYISRRFKVILRPLLPLQEGRSTPGRWCGKETWLDQGCSMLSLGRVDANAIYGEM